VWPAIVVGLAYPTIAGSSRRDAELLEAAPLPGGWLRLLARIPHLWTWLPIIAAIAIAVAFGYFRVGITAAYPESIAFLCLAVALGMVSPAASLLMTLVFVPLDLVTALQGHVLDPLIPAIAGRFISWWLLFVLAVAIPLVCRGVPGAVLAAASPPDPLVRRLVGYASAGLTCAVLVWLWTQAAPLLIAPLFTWSDGLRVPSAAATAVAGEWQNVVTAALFALLGMSLLRDSLGSLDEEANEIRAASLPGGAREARLLPDQSQIALQLLAAAFFTLMLGGIVREPLDILILFLMLAAAGPAIRMGLVGVPGVVATIVRVPWLVRLLVGTAIGIVVGAVLFLAAGMPVVIVVALDLLVFELLLQPDVAADEIAIRRGTTRRITQDPGASPATAGLGGAAALVLIVALAIVPFLIAPASALAADSAPATPTASSAVASAAAAVGAATLVIITMVAARPVSARQLRGRLRRKPRRRTATVGRHAAVATSVMDRLADEVSRARDRALDNYRRG
jgi:hypothetical protein